MQETFEKVSKMTTKSGLLLIESWNEDSLMRKLMGQNWHQYSPPSVLRWFTPNRLERILAGYDYKLLKKGGMTKFIYGSHVKSLLSYKNEGTALASVLKAGLSLIPNKLLIPYPSEDLFYMVLQKN